MGSVQELRPGAAQKVWVQSQTTFAVLVKDEEGGWGARVLKQKIWVEGVSYELQEIYGMENSASVPSVVCFASLFHLLLHRTTSCMSRPKASRAVPRRRPAVPHGIGLGPSQGDDAMAVGLKQWHQSSRCLCKVQANSPRAWIRLEVRVTDAYKSM